MATENPSALWSLTTAAARAEAQPWLHELAKEGIRKTCQHMAAAWSRGDVTALGDILAGLQQQSAHLNDRRVGAAQVLLGAVINGPHTLLDGKILGIGALNPRVVYRSLSLSR